MSNRTLIEVNHDYAGYIADYPAEFMAKLSEHLRSIPYNAIPYEIFPGVRVLGARHHSDAVDVAWGAYRYGEPSRDPPRPDRRAARMSDLFMERGAEISDCGRYRYALWRTWDKSKPRLLWVMLNPSTADASVDDATIRVCVGRAQRMGFGRIRVVNLFAWRATDPRELATVADPIGPEGDQALFRAISGTDQIICAWGDGGLMKGRHRPRWREALEIFAYDYGEKCYALKLTKAGQPCHPLRIGYSVEPFVWMDRERWLAIPRPGTVAAS